uniref:RUNX1 partner transcriptional co-repressor 1 n=1 Tax=Callithrix jacchus TaxID=9483 RepID=A0A2R8MZ07_CALJA
CGRSRRTARGAPAPRRTLGRPADKCVAFLESERGRARQTQTPLVTVAIPCAPHHICLPQQQQQKSGGREGGGRRGAELRKSWALLGGCVWLASPTSGFLHRSSLCAAPGGGSRSAARLRGLVASARGQVAADTLASRGKPRRALAPSPRGPAETTGSFICSSEPVADGGTLRPCAVTKENGFDREPLHSEHPSKRPCTISPGQRYSPNNGLSYQPNGLPHPTPPPPQHYRLDDMAIAHHYRDSYRHPSHRDLRDRNRPMGLHGTRQEEMIDHRLTDREWAEEWKHLDHLLNCIMDMVEKTRRSLTVLRRCQEADREELNYWIRRYSDAEDLKKGGGSSSSHSRQQSPVNPDPVALGNFSSDEYLEHIFLMLLMLNLFLTSF